VTLRRPHWIEIAIQVVLGVFVLLNGYDFINALSAQSCVGGATPGCYPWGAEGPAAGLWNYETKQRYLASTAAGFLITAIALATPFIATKPRWGVLAMLLISVGGNRLANWLLPMIMA
jgi:hypothetical protein